MALTLDASVGGVHSNSYCSDAEFDAYRDSRLHNSTLVTAATADTVARALVTATRLLDEHIEWVGFIYDFEQALAWPRSGCVDQHYDEIGVDEIPQKLKEAVAEFACQLIDADRTADAGQGISRVKVGGIEVGFTEAQKRKVIPDAVYDMISIWDDEEGEAGTVELVRA